MSGLQERVGIVGSGAIAVGLARCVSAHGPVRVLCRSEISGRRVLDRCSDTVHPVLASTVPQVLEGCSFVVEAVVEDFEIKSRVLRRLGDWTSSDVVLATTTSSLDVEKLAWASGAPSRVVGLHVFNPVERMKTVELAFAPITGTDSRQRSRALCVAIDKDPVEVPPVPGYVVNRLLFPYLFSAVHLMEQQGLHPQQVDTCMTGGAGHPMGPLRLLDLVGLDVAVAIGRTLEIDPPAALGRLVSAGKLGRKTGSGFYEYDTDGSRS